MKDRLAGITMHHLSTHIQSYKRFSFIYFCFICLFLHNPDQSMVLPHSKFSSVKAPLVIFTSVSAVSLKRDLKFPYYATFTLLYNL